MFSDDVHLYLNNTYNGNIPYQKFLEMYKKIRIKHEVPNHKAAIDIFEDEHKCMVITLGDSKPTRIYFKNQSYLNIFLMNL